MGIIIPANISHQRGKAMKRTAKVASFFVFPITVLLAHVMVSTILKLYTIFPNLDMPFHYIGGLSVAYTSAQILSYLEKEKITAALNRVVFLIFVISLTATAAVFWEFAEFIGDRLLDTNVQVSLANTMQDQFLGILGGATWAFIYDKKPG
jgi:type II secretory pathway component PulF